MTCITFSEKIPTNLDYFLKRYFEDENSCFEPSTIEELLTIHDVENRLKSSAREEYYYFIRNFILTSFVVISVFAMLSIPFYVTSIKIASSITFPIAGLCGMALTTQFAKNFFYTKINLHKDLKNGLYEMHKQVLNFHTTKQIQSKEQITNLIDIFYQFSILDICNLGKTITAINAFINNIHLSTWDKNLNKAVAKMLFFIFFNKENKSKILNILNSNIFNPIQYPKKLISSFILFVLKYFKLNKIKKMGVWDNLRPIFKEFGALTNKSPDMLYYLKNTNVESFLRYIYDIEDLNVENTLDIAPNMPEEENNALVNTAKEHIREIIDIFYKFSVTNIFSDVVDIRNMQLNKEFINKIQNHLTAIPRSIFAWHKNINKAIAKMLFFMFFNEENKVKILNILNSHLFNPVQNTKKRTINFFINWLLNSINTMGILENILPCIQEFGALINKDPNVLKNHLQNNDFENFLKSIYN